MSPLRQNDDEHSSELRLVPRRYQKPVSPEELSDRENRKRRMQYLVERFKGGDEAAFDELTPIVGRMAYHLALRAVANNEIANEISQDALVRVYKKIGELGSAGAFHSWFYRIVLNLIHDYFRQVIRTDAAMVKLEAIRAMERKSSEEPLTALESDALRTAITDALSSLDDKHRETFLMKEVEGFSHSEIARILEVPVGTVWSRLSNARQQLQSILRRMGYGGGKNDIRR